MNTKVPVIPMFFVLVLASVITPGILEAQESDVAAEQELYERATERFRIVREQANLAAAESSQSTSLTTPYG